MNVGWLNRPNRAYHKPPPYNNQHQIPSKLNI